MSDEMACPSHVCGHPLHYDQPCPIGGCECLRRDIAPPNDESEAEFERRHRAPVVGQLERIARDRERMAWIFGARWGAEWARAHHAAAIGPTSDGGTQEGLDGN